ncbi:MAG: chloride channel protein [Myxococcota bacterium]
MQFDGLIERLAPRLPDRAWTRILALAVAVGIVGGLAAVGFEVAMGLVGEVVLGTADPSIAEIPPLRAALGATIAAALCGLAAGSTTTGKPIGIPDIVEYVRTGERAPTARDSAPSVVAALLAIGGGQSAGREGPIVQLAGTVATVISDRMQLPPGTARALTASGAAAGIAASFNSPLGGAFFAMEVLLGTFAVDTFAPVVVASVTGTVVGQLVMGDRLALQLPPMRLDPIVGIVLFPVLGVVCGLVSVALRGLLRLSAAQLDRLPGPPALRPVASGVAVGLLAAVGLPHVMGNGYALLGAVISGRVTLGIGMLALILAAKLVTTSLAYSGRSGGGIFAPTLFLGGITGELVGTAFAELVPSIAPAPGVFAAVGMGAVAAAVSHAPVTMGLMIAEMTGNYAIILPLLVAIAIATGIANATDRHSVYVQTLLDRGVRLNRRPEASVLRDLRVRAVMVDRGYQTVDPDAPFDVLAQVFLDGRDDEVFVVRDGYLVGMVELQDVKALLHDPGRRAGVTARSLARAVSVTRPDEPVGDVMEVFYRTGLEALPVLDDSGRIAGIVTERDVVGALNREILRTDIGIARVAVERAGSTEPPESFELPAGYHLATLDVTGAAGSTLRTLDLPGRLGVTVLAIDAWDGVRTVRVPASADRPLGPRDRLVVMGPPEHLPRVGRSIPPVD